MLSFSYPSIHQPQFRKRKSPSPSPSPFTSCFVTPLPRYNSYDTHQGMCLSRLFTSYLARFCYKTWKEARNVGIHLPERTELSDSLCNLEGQIPLKFSSILSYISVRIPNKYLYMSPIPDISCICYAECLFHNAIHNQTQIRTPTQNPLKQTTNENENANTSQKNHDPPTNHFPSLS